MASTESGARRRQPSGTIISRNKTALATRGPRMGMDRSWGCNQIWIWAPAVSTATISQSIAGAVHPGSRKRRMRRA
jgi:hypothetical protein